MASAVSPRLPAPQLACDDFAAKPRQQIKHSSSSREKSEGRAAALTAGKRGSASSRGSSSIRRRRRSSSFSSTTSAEEEGGEVRPVSTAGLAAEEARAQQLQTQRGGGGGRGHAATAALSELVGGCGKQHSSRSRKPGPTRTAAASESEQGGEGKRGGAAAGERKTCSSWSTSREQRLFYGCFLLLGSTLAISQVLALPVLLQMLFYTAPILYIGSHASLRQNEVDACTGERPNRAESLNHTDALLFPVFGSIALVTLYIAYKFLDASWINFLLTLYLTAIGTVALAETLHVAFYPLFPVWMVDESRVLFRLRLPHVPLLMSVPPPPPPAAAAAAASSAAAVAEAERRKEAEANANCLRARSYARVFSYLAAALLSGCWLYSKHWVVHNLLAIAFCIQAIGLVSVGNFTVATILLSGLFIYDIFWVFGTDVMVTVAKSFEGPAKLIFPVQLDPWQQSILGLGDVVVPGVLISMCLRFDYWLHNLCNSSNRSSLFNSRTLTAASSSSSCTVGAGGGSSETVPRSASPAAEEKGSCVVEGGAKMMCAEAAGGPTAAATGGGAAAMLTRRGRAAKAAAAAAEGEDEEGDVTASLALKQHEKESGSNQAMARRFGEQFSEEEEGDIVHHRFNKFYFWVVLIFYEWGLITTGVVMLFFQHPQPALLYLVPFCLFSLFGAAALNGQVKEVLVYREDDDGVPVAAAGEKAETAADAAAAAEGKAAALEDDEEEEEEDDEEDAREKRKTR